MIRATIREWLTADPSLVALVPAARWIQRGAAVDIPPTPYVVLADLGTGTGRQRLLGVYVHDDRGSFVRIDNILKLVQDRLEIVQQYKGSDGRLVEAMHQSTTDDLFDDPTGTNVKNSVFTYLGVRNG